MHASRKRSRIASTLREMKDQLIGEDVRQMKTVMVRRLLIWASALLAVGSASRPSLYPSPAGQAKPDVEQRSSAG
jgi:hypothetical protein